MEPDSNQQSKTCGKEGRTPKKRQYRQENGIEKQHNQQKQQVKNAIIGAFYQYRCESQYKSGMFDMIRGNNEQRCAQGQHT